MHKHAQADLGGRAARRDVPGGEPRALLVVSEQPTSFVIQKRRIYPHATSGLPRPPAASEGDDEVVLWLAPQSLLVMSRRAARAWMWQAQIPAAKRRRVA
jgi:hypothetical protein